MRLRPLMVRMQMHKKASLPVSEQFVLITCDSNLLGIVPETNKGLQHITSPYTLVVSRNELFIKAVSMNYMLQPLYKFLSLNY